MSTNSITQGEQAGALWSDVFERYAVKIRFAYRPFAWESEAKGKAHVHVVIVGFAACDGAEKRIYECDGDTVRATKVRNISPYLVEDVDRVIGNREKPLCDVPEIGIGNKPIDGGYYLFTPEEKAAFLKVESCARRFFRRWVGSDELINGTERWCLWLGDCPPQELRSMPESKKRAQLVAKYRRGEIPAKGKPDTEQNRRRNALTQKLAESPTRFHVENMPAGRSLVIPKVSSERRQFIPIAYVSPRVLVSDLAFLMPNATLFHFGVLTSSMHMAWVRQVCGRLESRYRYSAKLVYNNFPWPESPSEKQFARVEAAAQAVLDARERISRTATGWPNSMTPWQCPFRWSRPIGRWTSPWTAAIGANRLARSGSGWNSSSPSTRSSLRRCWGPGRRKVGGPTETDSPVAGAAGQPFRQHEPRHASRLAARIMAPPQRSQPADWPARATGCRSQRLPGLGRGDNRYDCGRHFSHDRGRHRRARRAFRACRDHRRMRPRR